MHLRVFLQRIFFSENCPFKENGFREFCFSENVFEKMLYNPVKSRAAEKPEVGSWKSKVSFFLGQKWEV